MGLMNSPAKRAYSLILSVSMTTVMRYYQGGGGGGGACLLSDNRISGFNNR